MDGHAFLADFSCKTTFNPSLAIINVKNAVEVEAVQSLLFRTKEQPHASYVFKVLASDYLREYLATGVVLFLSALHF